MDKQTPLLTNPHIAIVGGGMVGMSLALLLSQQLPKVSISLIEQHSFTFEEFSLKDKLSAYQPSFDERSTALSAGSQHIFNDLQCWPELESYAQTIATIHVSDKGHWGGTRLHAVDYGVPALGYVIENRRLGQVLLHQLQQTNVDCIAPAQVLHCQPCQRGYQLTIRRAQQEQQLTADLLVIADGSQSPLRQSLGIDSSTKDYGQTAMVANVALSKPHQGIAYERFTDEGPIALLPLPDLPDSSDLQDNHPYRAALVWTFPSDRQQTINALDESALRRLLQQRFGYRAGVIEHIGQRHYYPLQLLQAREQIRSHLVVVGNAAHFLHPVAGQGFNLALRDCQQLVRCLSNSPLESLGTFATLKTYMQTQTPDQDFTITITDRLVKVFSSQRARFALSRQLGLLGLNTLPLGKTRFARQMMGLV